MSRLRSARWIATVGVVGLVIALFNGFAASALGWLISYALLIALSTLAWAFSGWKPAKLVGFQFVALGVLQSIGIWSVDNGEVVTPGTYLSGALLGFLLSALITLLWVAFARGGCWLEERYLRRRRSVS